MWRGGVTSKFVHVTPNPKVHTEGCFRRTNEVASFENVVELRTAAAPRKAELLVVPIAVHRWWLKRRIPPRYVVEWADQVDIS